MERHRCYCMTCMNIPFVKNCVFSEYRYLRFFAGIPFLHQWLYKRKKNKHDKLKAIAEKEMNDFINSKKPQYLDNLVKKNIIMPLTSLCDSPPIIYKMVRKNDDFEVTRESQD